MLFSSTTQFLAKKFGFERAIDMLIEAGFPAIDFSMFDLSIPVYTDDYKEVAKRILKKANDSGVVFNQAHAPFGGGYENYTQKLVPLFDRAFEFAAMTGVKNMVVHPLQQGKYNGREKHLFEMNMEFYSSLAPLAKKTGVKIAIENMWRNHEITKRIIDDVCAPPEELALYYDTLNDPEAFTVCLDLGHVAICQREPENAIRTIGKRLGCLHVHDVDYINDLHTLPGVGRINWNNVCSALAEVGYDGDLTLEADHFFDGFDISLAPTVAKFMADVTRNLAAKVDYYKSNI